MADSKAAKIRKAAGEIGLVAPMGKSAPTQAPPPDEVWQLPGGSARVYYGEGRQGVVRPVVLADGFDLGPTDYDWLWDGLENGRFPFVSELRRRGRTLILVGFDERSESILRNAETMMAAIMRTAAEQLGDTRLLVGGFSMGGIVARYALARMELQRIDHRVGCYVSFDSPHRGAWVPIGLQAFAHYLAQAGDDTYLRQISSPASQQMLWRHLDALDGTSMESPLRKEFKEELQKVGGWPRIPRLIGVSSGRGDGVGNGVRAGAKALTCAGPLFDGTYFLAQSKGEKAEVAVLNGVLGGPHTITTSGFPELDGAPGGTLESFGIIGDTLRAFGENVDLVHRSVCFVPSVSAVSIRDLDRQDDLYLNIDQLPPEESDLDDFLLSYDNDPHALMTEDIGQWVLDRLPD
ncbi:esterase/lipase family protein [Streptomyces triticiradicis]|uniref:Alpha/beta hydrolase n=1 Tax=Streptomyces triticiradicis TaxID=2651189 RepID=A0A7J5DCX0_9ACTN|nr:alpha/beta hydrolase [Streptomyces triticiradicis]KAB1986419.1 alpha/beta hydrolase [Streptomyces triticiradicis]